MGVFYRLVYLMPALLFIAHVSSATRFNLQGRSVVPHNATLHRRNDFNKYGGCNKQYPQGKGKELVNRAKYDMFRLAYHSENFCYDNHNDIYLNPGPLEERFFGRLLKDNDNQKATIGNIFSHIANWYPWWFFDWIGGGRIEVYCEVDQPNPEGLSCTKYQGMGAYALNVNGKAQIVFCQLFFEFRNTLADIRRDLNNDGERNKNLNWMDSAARVFLHEMTHLAVIDGTPERFVVDKYYKDENGNFKKAYKPRGAEMYAAQAPQYAYLNADNYAWYATANYFGQWWGIPDPNIHSVDVEDFMDDSVDDDSKPTNIIPNIFEHPDWDDISTDEAIAFAAGDYTPNGWLQGKNLRMLPLGDSITNGFGSSDGNGYREDLEKILVNANNRVQMVGSLRSGNMAQNEHEGHNGATIAQIATYTSAYDRRPNVVLLHAGTNDLNAPSEPSTAPQRLDSLVGQLVAALPDAIIIVARIVPSANAGTSNMMPQFNNAITDLMATRVQNGQRIVMVDMPSGVTTADLSDGLHPNDEGYNKMAIKWAIALTAANDRGWIREPVPGQGGGPTTCPHDPTWIPQGEIAHGAGLGPDLFLTVSCASNPISGLCDCQSPATENALTRELLDSKNICDIRTLAFPLAAAVHFVDLNGDGRAEFLYVGNNGDLTAFLNLGGPDNGPNAAKVQWLPSGEIGHGINIPRRSVQFADLNGDGRAEYLRVNDNGSIEAWLNLGGPDNGPNAAKVRWLEQGTIATGIGKDGAGVRFADLNGDGRAEYLYVHTDGSVEAYLNLGGLDGKESDANVAWLPQGVIATGVGLGRDNVIFADINGDGRADYVAVDRTVGSAQLWLNGGGPDIGPSAAKVVWYPHGTITTGVGGVARGLQFADLNGDGRAEYLDVAFDTSAVRAWLNGC